jgi:O-antigen/teichoic acid export membrane protein
MVERIKRAAYNVLRKSERYTKTDMVYLTKGGIWLSISQGVAMVTGLLVAIAFANLLTPETFGTYKFVLSLAGIIGAFSLTGMSTALIRSVANGQEGALEHGFGISLKWGVSVTVISLAFAIYYYLNDNATLAMSMLLVGTFSPLMDSAALFSSYLAGKKAFRKQAFSNIGRIIFPALALIATLTLTSNVVVIIAVYFAGNTLMTLYYYYNTLRTSKPSANKDAALIGYSKHLSLMNILNLVGNHFDKVLVFHFLGAGPLALYAFAIAPVDQLRSGNKILQALILPKLSMRAYSDLQRSVPQKALHILLFSGGVVLAYIVFAPFLYLLLFPQYIEAVFYSQFYAVTLLFTPATLFEGMLIAHKRKKELYLGKIGAPLIKMALFIVLLPAYGLTGLIVALLLARLSNMLILILLSKRV